MDALLLHADTTLATSPRPAPPQAATRWHMAHPEASNDDVPPRAVAFDNGLAVRLLDEIDYGVLLLDEDGRIQHVNHLAALELDASHPLQRLGGELRARRGEDQASLAAALAGARQGLRRLVTLGPPGREVAMSVVPLEPARPGIARLMLLVLGKRHLCEPLSVQWFARAHGLTPAETRVLEALCDGLDARDIAERHGVGLATVRTQIGAIRAKTRADSIRDLVLQVATLPPMMSVLRAS